jgi:hypothetical protein
MLTTRDYIIIIMSTNHKAPSQISLQKRWAVIQKAVTKFCGFKSAVDRRNESGKHEYYRVNSYGTYLLVSLNSYGTCLLTCSDFKFQIDDAVKMYERTKSFHFIHCWKLLSK